MMTQVMGSVTQVPTKPKAGISHRADLGKGQDFLHGLRGVIVGDANGANFPVPNRLLQGPIHRFVVPPGLMDQHQIYVIQPQIPKRMIDTMRCAE